MIIQLMMMIICKGKQKKTEENNDNTTVYFHFMLFIPMLSLFFGCSFTHCRQRVLMIILQCWIVNTNQCACCSPSTCDCNCDCVDVAGPGHSGAVERGVTRSRGVSALRGMTVAEQRPATYCCLP
jgi:hypothetical protein